MPPTPLGTSVSEGVNPAEMDSAEVVRGNPMWVSSLREDDDRQTGKHPLQVNVPVKKGSFHDVEGHFPCNSQRYRYACAEGGDGKRKGRREQRKSR